VWHVLGCLVSDDLDPALDLWRISPFPVFDSVGARTSGILAVLQSAAIW
jgi:hypothetical protein